MPNTTAAHQAVQPAKAHPTPEEDRMSLNHSAIDADQKIVHVCAVAIRNEQGMVLTVRKAGTNGFMMPGGKPDPGETPLQAAVREVTEELGFTPDTAGMVHLGTFEAAALNEAGFTVCAETYEYLPHHSEYRTMEQLSPQAEIVELRWVHPNPAEAAGLHTDQAPLNTECIFPVLTARSAPGN